MRDSGGERLASPPVPASAASQTSRVSRYNLRQNIDKRASRDNYAPAPAEANFAMVVCNVLTRESNMDMIRKAFLVALTLAGGVHLAQPAAAMSATSSEFACQDNVMGLCEAYCAGYNYCIVHWENRENCSFHVDGCID